MTDVEHSENELRLLELLKEKSFEQREVTLSSGRKSNFYIDCKQVSLSAEGLYLIGHCIFSVIEKLDGPIHAVGGPTLGADPMVSAVSMTSYLESQPIPAFIIRKKPKSHGTQAWIEGASNIPEGGRVVLLEDVITTGATVLDSAKKVEDAGYQIACFVVLVDRDEGAREIIEEAGYKVYSLFRRRDFF